MTSSAVARVNWPPRFHGISRLHLSELRLWLCSSAAHPTLFTQVRGIRILGSSALPWCSGALCFMAHIHSPHTGVCCLRYVLRGSKGEVAFGEKTALLIVKHTKGERGS